MKQSALVTAASRDADAVLILTDWKEFARINLERLKQTVRFPIVIDGRNLYNAQKLLDLGFTYLSMGRPSNHHVLQGRPCSSEQEHAALCPMCRRVPVLASYEAQQYPGLGSAVPNRDV
jgi:hypothetical protein